MSIFTSIGKYFIDSYNEMKKVSWPTKNQTINYSILVVGLSVGTALFFTLLDYVFNFGITQIISR